MPNESQPKIGVKYRAVKNDDGTYSIFDVPIFGTLPAGQRGNEKTIDREWMLKALERANTAAAGGFIPPVHFAHPGGGSWKTCSFRLSRVGKMTLEGKEMDVLFADLLEVGEDIVQAIEAGQFPYRSVEVRDWNEPNVNALGLLSGDPPYFRFPRMIGVQVEQQEIAGPAMAFDGGLVAALAADAGTRHLSAVFNFDGAKLGMFDRPAEVWNRASAAKRRAILKKTRFSDSEIDLMTGWEWSDLSTAVKKAVADIIEAYAFTANGDERDAPPFEKKDEDKGDDSEGGDKPFGGKDEGEGDEGGDGADDLSGAEDSEDRLTRIEKALAQLVAVTTKLLEKTMGSDGDEPDERQPVKDEGPEAQNGDKPTQEDEMPKDKKDEGKCAQMDASGTATLAALQAENKTLSSQVAQLTAKCDQLSAGLAERERKEKTRDAIEAATKRLRAKRIVLPATFAATCEKMASYGDEALTEYVNTLESTGRTDPPETQDAAFATYETGDSAPVAALAAHGAGTLEQGRRVQAEFRAFKAVSPNAPDTLEDWLRARKLPVAAK